MIGVATFGWWSRSKSRAKPCVLAQAGKQYSNTDKHGLRAQINTDAGLTAESPGQLSLQLRAAASDARCILVFPLIGALNPCKSVFEFGFRLTHEPHPNPSNPALTERIGGITSALSPDSNLMYHIIGLETRVHRHLGPGLLESAYERRLCWTRYDDLSGEAPLTRLFRRQPRHPPRRRSCRSRWCPTGWCAARG